MLYTEHSWSAPSVWMDVVRGDSQRVNWPDCWTMIHTLLGLRIHTEQNCPRGCVCVSMCIFRCLCHKTFACVTFLMVMSIDEMFFPLFFEVKAILLQRHVQTVTRARARTPRPSELRYGFILFWWAHNVVLPRVMSSGDLPEHTVLSEAKVLTLQTFQYSSN